jgi:lipopolysaccharide biosynthesis regulator YciM
MFQALQRWLPRPLRKESRLTSQLEGTPPVSQDTMTAIAQLSQVIKNNQDSVETYMALGNLYRAQGEIENAITIRQSLIVRPNLKPEFKSRALYELGIDYKRGGFLGRAQNAFERARELIGEDPAIIDELASLAAAEHDYQLSAQFYAQLSKPIHQAHYLVQQAKQDQKNKKQGKGTAWLNKALKVYPGSVEAWLEKMVRAYDLADWKTLADSFDKGLYRVEPHLRFILLEGLIQHLFQSRTEQEIFTPLLTPEAGNELIKVLKKQPADIVLSYYGSWILLQLGHQDQAARWLDQCIQLDPEFWPARLEMLSLDMDGQDMKEDFREQMVFFLKRARQIKKFICTRCGLKREHLFFVCPRCRSWHTISFLKVLGN